MTYKKKGKRLTTGRFSKEDLRFISDNLDMSDEELGKKFNRNPNIICKQRAKITAKQSLAEKEVNIHETYEILKSSGVKIEKELLDDEVDYFKSQWARLTEQFSGSDIVPTDEMQIRECIILEIYEIRASQKIKSEEENIIERRKELKREDNPDRRNEIRTEIQSALAALPTLQRAFLELKKQKNDTLRSLKATRDSRFKKYEESKKNIFELIKDLDTAKRRKREGEWAEKLKMSKDKIGKEWNDSIKYTEDSLSYDKPFLNPDFIEQDSISSVSTDLLNQLEVLINQTENVELIDLIERLKNNG